MSSHPLPPRPAMQILLARTTGLFTQPKEITAEGKKDLNSGKYLAESYTYNCTGLREIHSFLLKR